MNENEQLALLKLNSVIFLSLNLQQSILRGEKAVDNKLLLELQSIDFNLACIPAKD
jgi:hypothetical protein